MSNTRIRLSKQIEKSTANPAVPFSNSSNELIFSTAPGPGADKIFFYDDSATTLTWLTIGTNLSITGTTLNASAGAGGITTVQEEGSDLTSRSKINFIGSGVTAVDDAPNSRTNVALDPDLNALADLSSTGFPVRTGSNTWAQRTILGTADRVTVTNGSGVSGNPTIDIASTYAGQASITTLGTISTGVWNGSVITQPYLDSNIAYVDEDNTFTGNNTFSNNVTLTVNPVNPTHLVTKGYVDNYIQGLSPKESVKAATTGVLAGVSWAGGQFTNAPTTLDGITLNVGNRVLVKDETNAERNGIYIVSGATTWDRANDGDAWEDLISAFTFVEEGTVNADKAYLCTVDAGGTLNTTDVDWVLFSSATDITAGAGLTKTGSTIDVVTANASRIVVNPDSIDLATTGVTPNTYGSASNIASFTVDAYGRLTAASNIPINISTTNISNFTENVQDVVGTLFQDSATIDFVYDDVANTLTGNLTHLGLENLSDPMADRLLFWDNSASATAWLSLGTGLSISTTTLNVDFGSNTVSSFTLVDDEAGILDPLAWQSEKLTATTGQLEFIDGPGIDIDYVSSSANYLRFRHTDTSSVSNLNTVGAQVIDLLEFDTYGHVTNVTTRLLSASDILGEGLPTKILYIEGQALTNVDYTSNAGITKDVNGINATFTGTVPVDRLQVYKNGLLMGRTGIATTRDYSITGTVITFEEALVTSDRVILKVIDTIHY